MAKKKKRKPKLFIQLHHDFYDSKEWRSLHWYSKLVYLRIKRKYNPKINEKIAVSYREMADEMCQSTFGKAIKELIKVGFVEVIQKGGLFRKRNYYILSYRWKSLKLSCLPRVAMVDIHKALPHSAVEIAKKA